MGHFATGHLNFSTTNHPKVAHQHIHRPSRLESLGEYCNDGHQHHCTPSAHARDVVNIYIHNCKPLRHSMFTIGPLLPFGCMVANFLLTNLLETSGLRLRVCPSGPRATGGGCPAFGLRVPLSSTLCTLILLPPLDTRHVGTMHFSRSLFPTRLLGAEKWVQSGSWVGLGHRTEVR